MKYQYSFSRIKSFETCPLLFKLLHLDRVDRVKRGVFVPMEIGAIGHRAIQEYTSHCLEKKLQSDLAVVEDIAIKIFNEEGTLESQYLDEVIMLMKCYTDSHLIDLKYTVGAEERIALDEQFKRIGWEDEKVFIRGIIDLLQIRDNVAKITDYKTGWSMDYDRFQLKLYAWLVSKLYPQVEWFQIALDFVRFETSKEEEFGMEDVKRTEKQLMALIKKIDALGLEDFKPMPGKGCATCGCWQWCPVDLNKIEKLPQNLEEAKKLAEEILVLEGLYESKRALLKKYCADSGNVGVGGVEFGHWKNSSLKFNPSEFFVLMTNLNRVNEVFDYFTIDGRKIEKLMKEEDTREKLLQIGKEQVSVRFDKKVVKNEQGSEGNSAKLS